jgi:hypothetical protein
MVISDADSHNQHLDDIYIGEDDENPKKRPK